MAKGSKAFKVEIKFEPMKGQGGSMKKHSKSPWKFANLNGNERADGSTWGAEGLWSSDNHLILGTADGWDSGFQSPQNENDKKLLESAPELLKVAKWFVACVVEFQTGNPKALEISEKLCEEAEAIIKKAGG